MTAADDDAGARVTAAGRVDDRSRTLHLAPTSDLVECEAKSTMNAQSIAWEDRLRLYGPCYQNGVLVDEPQRRPQLNALPEF